MKQLSFTLLVLIIALTSCKKDFSRQNLIGTWVEIQPCVRGSSDCYYLQFTSANKVYETPADTITGHYDLLSSTSIQIDSNIVWPGDSLQGSLVFQISTSGNEMTIKNFYTPLIWTGITPVPVYDVHLQKM
jgi:hypothetical protein